MQELGDRTRLTRPGIVTYLAALQITLGGLLAVAGIGLCVYLATAAAGRRAWWALAIAALAVVVSSPLHILCGIDLFRLKPRGWSLLRAWACLLMLLIPVGTFVGILLLTFLNSPGVRVLFEGRSLEELSYDERRALAMTQGSYAPMVTAAIGTIVLAALAVATAVAAWQGLPGLGALGAANEDAVIATLTRIHTAEQAYASVNADKFGSPRCLAAPSGCIPGYTGPPFSDEKNLSFSRHGYVFQFFSAETVEPEMARRRGATDAQLEGYAVLALPIIRGAGTRMFCLDGTGTISYARAPMRPPSIVPEVCPSRWTTVRGGRSR